MRPAVLVLLAALLALAPLAAQAEDVGAEDARPVGPVPWTADEAGLAPPPAGDEAPSVALDGAADPLTDEAGAQGVQPPNGPVLPNIGGLVVPRFCIQGYPFGACFVGPSSDSLRPLPKDNTSEEEASGAPADAAVLVVAEPEPEEPADGPATSVGVQTPPPDPVPAPTAPHGGVPSRRSPSSLQQASLPANRLSWQIATAAFALPSALLAKLASVLVLRRRARDTSPTMRDAVQEAIAARPGIRHRELVRRIGRGNGTVEHHVRRLIAEGKVARLRVGASTAYALAGDLSAQEAGLRLALEGRTSRRLAIDVAAHPASRLTEVALRVGVSLATAHYQAGKLVAAGILRDVAGAGGRRLEPTPAGLACLAAVTADGPAVASPFGAPLGLRAMASST
jgi:DNA-binding MarR family transcriptional regulator